MPLDTSTYNLALLRLDGRRWNELRRLTAQISTQASADGSSYLEMGNTKIICTVSGPHEPSTTGARGGDREGAELRVEIGVAPFSGIDRKRGRRGDKCVSLTLPFLFILRGGVFMTIKRWSANTFGNDRRITELAHTLTQTFTPQILTHLYPHSTITLSLQILSSDGSLLSALINASTLALIDAGIPLKSYISSCTAGSTSSHSSNEEEADPLLDLNGQEEMELPFLTVATVGGTDEVVALVLETRVQVGRVEGMLAVGVDGCKQVMEILDAVVRERGKRVLEGGRL